MLQLKTEQIISVRLIGIYVIATMFANPRYVRFHRLCRGYKSDSKHYAQQPQLIAKNQQTKSTEIDFAKAKHGTFFQQPHQLRNPWTSDIFANKLAQSYLPKEVIKLCQASSKKKLISIIRVVHSRFSGQ